MLTLSDDIYIRFRDLLLARCGLHYPERKRADLAYGLQQALGASELLSLEALYAGALEQGPAWKTLITQLTIGETYFFRNEPQFNALRQHILPEIIGRRQAMHSLRVWSAGCATGEEPYSLAITLSEQLPDYEAWQISILATDINHDFLNRAREALYGDWSFRETPAPLRARYFCQDQNRWRLRPEFRRMVSFAPLNLADPCYPTITNGTCALDIIICRNVTIYFDEATTRKVADRFYRALAPGGWLIVGHAEPHASTYHQFEACNFLDTVVYRKPLDAPLFAFEPQSGTFSAGSLPILLPRLQPQPPRQPISSPPAAIFPQPAPAPDSWPLITALLEREARAEAERQIQQLLLAQPDHVKALAALGRLCADRSDWEAARQHCERALKHSPLFVPAHYVLAQIYEHQGQLDLALAAYRRSVYLERSFVLGTLGMAAVWRQMGRSDDARRSYRNVIKQLASLDPHSIIPDSEGATAGELSALATQQLQLLEQL